MQRTDFIREDEMDGTGNMCAIRAIGFIEWLFKNNIHPEDDEDLVLRWISYDNEEDNEEYTTCSTEEVYRKYLKTLDIWRPSY